MEMLLLPHSASDNSQIQFSSCELNVSELLQCVESLEYQGNDNITSVAS